MVPVEDFIKIKAAAPSPPPSPPPSPSSPSHIPRSTDVVASDNESRSTSPVRDEPLHGAMKAKAEKNGSSIDLRYGHQEKRIGSPPLSMINSLTWNVWGGEQRPIGRLRVSSLFLLSRRPNHTEPFIAATKSLRLPQAHWWRAPFNNGKFGSCSGRCSVRPRLFAQSILCHLSGGPAPLKPSSRLSHGVTFRTLKAGALGRPPCPLLVR
ncbi:hypothetical protein HPP92_001163 [Vanilla planifolia]|uniref:Uncharacterized protein n=1 Tax=Vanilla planifolia TaxID=51239 RepID=A0A835S766_VANPL|nr:hypothetical protein HPP92_001163 [Vanilla planifolia]